MEILIVDIFITNNWLIFYLLTRENHFILIEIYNIRKFYSSRSILFHSNIINIQIIVHKHMYVSVYYLHLTAHIVCIFLYYSKF